MRTTFLLLSLLAVTALRAQQADFSGTWVFKDQQSVSGKLYSNGSPKQVKVTQGNQAITIEKVTAGADGTDVTSNETVSLEGQPFETTTASKRKKVITAQWTQDHKGLQEVAHLYDPSDSTKLVFTVTDIWEMDNGELVLDRKTENFSNGEVWESKATYDKQ